MSWKFSTKRSTDTNSVLIPPFASKQPGAGLAWLKASQTAQMQIDGLLLYEHSLSIMFFNFKNERQKLKNGNLATNNSVYNLLENDTSKSFESIGDDQFCMRRSSDIRTGIFELHKVKLDFKLLQLVIP